MIMRKVLLQSVLLGLLVLSTTGWTSGTVAAQMQADETCETAKVVACGRCGDGYCAKQCGETASSCPQDCGVIESARLMACSKCGDGRCTPQCGEDAGSCPKDCGVESGNALANLRD